jgi:molybdenum-dependent DNA-binding transcriptional regulator ModE
MVTDGQVRRLLRELDSGTSLAPAARRAGMSDKTARHYRDHRTLPGNGSTTWSTTSC